MAVEVGVEGAVEREIAGMFRGQEAPGSGWASLVQLVVSAAMVSLLLDAPVLGIAIAPDAAHVDQQRLVLAEEQRQELGHRLLPDAVPAVDIHQRCRSGVYWPAEYIGCGDGGRQGWTAVGHSILKLRGRHAS